MKRQTAYYVNQHLPPRQPHAIQAAAICKYIHFVELPNPAFPDRAPAWVVLNNRNNDMLGCCRWVAGWGCYLFEPEANASFDKLCLRDIADYLDKITKDRRAVIR